MKINKTVILLSVSIIAFLFAAPVSASTIDPFTYFNVYSLGNIQGRSDFQGTTGAVGNVSLTGFSLPWLDSNKYVLHAGGTVKLKGGTYNGSIEAAGNMELANLTVYGDVNSGGLVWNSGGGQIRGNVTAQNIQLNQKMTVYGQKNAGVPYQPYLDIFDCFILLSNILFRDGTGKPICEEF